MRPTAVAGGLIGVFEALLAISLCGLVFGAATVLADTDCTLARLSAATVFRMRREDPAVATALHAPLARHLAGKLADTLRIVDARTR